MLPLMLPNPATAASFGTLSPDGVRFTGDQDLLLPFTWVVCDESAEVPGFAITDLKKRFAFSRVTASLNRRSRLHGLLKG